MNDGGVEVGGMGEEQISKCVPRLATLSPLAKGVGNTSMSVEGRAQSLLQVTFSWFTSKTEIITNVADDWNVKKKNNKEK
ncbi:hypothetical protein C0Q70_02017 [Pomacea canaliculata]|uniref:Uncharacterized protein n=1 Tax=Pomacea canaliculata TaxID=400727 RepID=A0A2T7Q167_POMCA|nr:hypothetical protein C0Q70_02017 [Pomacea canaliculata]